jgi:hypothetical protein
VNAKLDSGRNRIAIASFNRWKYLALVWVLPVLLVIAGYYSVGLNLFTIDHMLEYKAVIVPKVLAIPLMVGGLIFLIFHTFEIVLSKGIFIWTDGDIVKVVGRKKVLLSDLDFSKRARAGPLNSVVVIPRHSGGELRIPTGVIRETEDALILSFQRDNNAISNILTAKAGDGRD